MEHEFITKVISGHRVTIPELEYNDLNLVEGDIVKISVSLLTHKKGVSE